MSILCLCWVRCFPFRLVTPGLITCRTGCVPPVLVVALLLVLLALLLVAILQPRCFLVEAKTVLMPPAAAFPPFIPPSSPSSASIRCILSVKKTCFTSGEPSLLHLPPLPPAAFWFSAFCSVLLLSPLTAHSQWKEKKAGWGWREGVRSGEEQRMDSPFSTFSLSHCRPLPPSFFYLFSIYFEFVFFCNMPESQRRRGSAVEHPTIPFVRLGVVADHTHTHTHTCVCVCARMLLYLVLVRQMAGGGCWGWGEGGEEKNGAGGDVVAAFFFLLILLSPSQTSLFLCATPH